MAADRAAGRGRRRTWQPALLAERSGVVKHSGLGFRDLGFRVIGLGLRRRTKLRATGNKVEAEFAARTTVDGYAEIHRGKIAKGLDV